jgi:hypothetical protein
MKHTQGAEALSYKCGLALRLHEFGFTALLLWPQVPYLVAREQDWALSSSLPTFS